MRKLVLLILGLIFPTTALAHGIGEVYALPVPLQYYLLGAGLAVAFSFFVLAIFMNKSRTPDQNEKILSTPWLSPVLTAAKVIAFFFLILTMATGILGSQNALNNFAPIFFWVYFLIGIGILSIALGNIWEKINPWKTLTDWMGINYSYRLISGVVGIVLLLALFWLELSSGLSFQPRMISSILIFYTLVNLVGAQLFKNWYKDAELFSVLFGFVGTLSYLSIGDDNRSIQVINQNKKLNGQLAKWWTLGIASILLAGASFDSLKETVMWFQWLNTLGFTSDSLLAPTLGIILAPIPFLLSYLFAVWVMKHLVGREYSTLSLAQQFIWSLIPIAFGYTLAHNFSLFIATAPRMFALISDPFGFGWNLFGTSRYISTDLLLGAKMVWFIEIGFVVLAHIFGVWYAHVLALNIFKDPKQALKSQVPMALLMVGFTIMTLWLLSQPLVVAK